MSKRNHIKYSNKFNNNYLIGIQNIVFFYGMSCIWDKQKFVARSKHIILNNIGLLHFLRTKLIEIMHERFYNPLATKAFKYTKIVMTLPLIV